MSAQDTTPKNFDVVVIGSGPGGVRSCYPLRTVRVKHSGGGAGTHGRYLP